MRDNDKKPTLFELYGLVDVREPDRIRYVGLTTQTIRKRLFGHWKTASREDPPKYPVHRWMKKRTRDQIEALCLGTFETHEELVAGEIAVIAYYRSLGQADLNVTAGGEGMYGYIASEETREKLRAAMKDRAPTVMSPEARQRMSVRMSNRTPEQLHAHADAVGKLSDEDVREIRRLFLTGMFSQKELAYLYGVGYANIWSVVNNKTWKHVH